MGMQDHPHRRIQVKVPNVAPVSTVNDPVSNNITTNFNTSQLSHLNQIMTAITFPVDEFDTGITNLSFDPGVGGSTIVIGTLDTVSRAGLVEMGDWHSAPLASIDDLRDTIRDSSNSELRAVMDEDTEVIDLPGLLRLLVT